MIRLSDVFIPQVYGSYTALDNPETSAFVTAGIIQTSDLLNAVAKAGSKTLIVPFWRDINPNIEPNYSNDDPNDLAVPNNINSGTMTARKVWLNQSFGEMDLVQELAGQSPLQHVKNRFGTYWTRQMNRRLIATCVGILANNVTSFGGDMLVDISGNAGAAAQFSSAAFIDAAYTMGDQVDNITAIAIHSAIEGRMAKNNEIDTIRDSDGQLVMRTYKGRQVIVDDSLPVSGVGATRIFTSILFGGGAFGFGATEGHAFAMGEGVSKVPSEVYRTPMAGHGGGMESIWERKTWILHPFGFEWVEAGAVLAEFSPSLADLRLGAHWNRIVDYRKQVPLAFVKSMA
jgi:hypothetical protein